MQFLSERLVHTNVSYYDIEAAGPTTLVQFGLWGPDQLEIDKQKRNILYGKFCKQYNLTQLCYSIYSSFIKIIAAQCKAVLITPDSLVTSYDPFKLAIVRDSFYKLRMKWKASIFVAAPDKRNYIAIERMNNNRVIAKGPLAKFIPVGCIQKLIKTYQLGGNWLYTFKNYFRNANVVDFISPQRIILLKSGVYEVGENVGCILPNDIDRERYWRIVCLFIFSLQQNWR